MLFKNRFPFSVQYRQTIFSFTFSVSIPLTIKSLKEMVQTFSIVILKIPFVCICCVVRLLHVITYVNSVGKTVRNLFCEIGIICSFAGKMYLLQLCNDLSKYVERKISLIQLGYSFLKIILCLHTRPLCTFKQFCKSPVF